VRGREQTEVHAVGNQTGLAIDAALFAEQRGRMHDDLIHPLQQTDFARRVRQVLVRETVFVVDVIAAEVVGDGIERACELVAPDVERDPLGAAREQSPARAGEPRAQARDTQPAGTVEVRMQTAARQDFHRRRRLGPAVRRQEARAGRLEKFTPVQRRLDPHDPVVPREPLQHLMSQRDDAVPIVRHQRDDAELIGFIHCWLRPAPDPDAPGGWC
jgi:hypothetical protein